MLRGARRRGIQARVSVAIATTMCAGVTLIGAIMVIAPGAKLGVRITGAVMAIGFAALARSAWRAGVWIEEEFLVVRHWARTEFIPWREITGFNVGPGTNVLQRTHTLHVHLRDGRDLRVQELSASAVVNRGRSFVHDAVEVLEHELQGHRDAPTTPS